MRQTGRGAGTTTSPHPHSQAHVHDTTALGMGDGCAGGLLEARVSTAQPIKAEVWQHRCMSSPRHVVGPLPFGTHPRPSISTGADGRLLPKQPSSPRKTSEGGEGGGRARRLGACRANSPPLRSAQPHEPRDRALVRRVGVSTTAASCTSAGSTGAGFHSSSASECQ